MRERMARYCSAYMTDEVPRPLTHVDYYGIGTNFQIVDHCRV